MAYFLKTTGALGVRESLRVDACHTQTTFMFEPDKYTGKKNQVVISRRQGRAGLRHGQRAEGRERDGFCLGDVAFQHGEDA